MGDLVAARTWTGASRLRAVPVLAALVALLVAGCGPSGGGTQAGGTSAATSSSASPTPTGPRKGSGEPVHIRSFENDGHTYGVGMPIILYLSRRITDASVFEEVAQVTVNGQPAAGAWYFEHSSVGDAELEAHYRPAQYWPAHAQIHVDLPVEGLWAGDGLVFDNSMTLDVNTGAAHLATVDGAAHTMVITSDGQPVKTLEVSLGAAKTPTYLGTAVLMAKSNPEEMKSDPGEQPAYDVMVPWSVRITDSGEFIHDASWNGRIGSANTSHGCTNLKPADAEWYYNWSQIGDPVTYKHTGTSTVIPATDGWGDWNVDWATWQHGGLLSTGQ
jgi:lipoprotein-anchoring transpeptidase ErfK/SrfK